MLYIGEKVGLGTHAPKALFPQVDIAVDPLEGTNLCATGAANAIAVLAASERGGLLHAPDLYMEKLRSEEHTSELQSHSDLVCRLLLEKKKKKKKNDKEYREKDTQRKNKQLR